MLNDFDFQFSIRNLETKTDMGRKPRMDCNDRSLCIRSLGDLRGQREKNREGR